ncbi:hypothetical protein LCGC14_3015260 [marine sediment metagenome]|uniref:Ubiquitin-like domain-containing protein n=1 Tax=marine sediment metagenome TaxID=412755 RepID=A0A0F8Z4K1_9ZZZZ
MKITIRVCTGWMDPPSDNVCEVEETTTMASLMSKFMGSHMTRHPYDMPYFQKNWKPLEGATIGDNGIKEGDILQLNSSLEG